MKEKKTFDIGASAPCQLCFLCFKVLSQLLVLHHIDALDLKHGVRALGLHLEELGLCLSELISHRIIFVKLPLWEQACHLKAFTLLEAKVLHTLFAVHHPRLNIVNHLRPVAESEKRQQQNVLQQVHEFSDNLEIYWIIQKISEEYLNYIQKCPSNLI